MKIFRRLYNKSILKAQLVKLLKRLINFLNAPLNNVNKSLKAPSFNFENACCDLYIPNSSHA
jgi:hypothetical protein